MPSTRSGKNSRPSGGSERLRSSRNTRLRSPRGQNALLDQANNSTSSSHSAANKRKRRASPDRGEASDMEETGEEPVVHSNLTTTTDHHSPIPATDNFLHHTDSASPIVNDPSNIDSTNTHDTSAQTGQEPPDDLPTIANYSLHENLRKWPKALFVTAPTS